MYYIPVYYVLGYVCIYAYLYTYMCGCGLRADHLASNNHLVCPFLRKTTSAHRFTWLPIVLCIGLSTNIFNKSGVIHDNLVIIKVFWRFFLLSFSVSAHECRCPSRRCHIPWSWSFRWVELQDVVAWVFFKNSACSSPLSQLSSSINRVFNVMIY